jgi:hypothetical protein
MKFGTKNTRRNLAASTLKEANKFQPCMDKKRQALEGYFCGKIGGAFSPRCYSGSRVMKEEKLDGE